jgi:hypothetical protein
MLRYGVARAMKKLLRASAASLGNHLLSDRGQETRMITHSGRKRAAISAKSSKKPARERDHDYDSLLVAVQRRFSAAIAGGAKLFRTDASNLWSLYLGNLPTQDRQFHNCHCCRKFIESYGDLVAISADGRLTPAMWGVSGGVNGVYDAPFLVMYERVKSARVTSVFLAKESIWGVPTSPGWTHLSVSPPANLLYCERLLTSGQAMAANKENYRNVMTALVEFKAPMLDEALRILRAEKLLNADKFIGPVKWLRDLQDRPRGRVGENIVWRAIADAPEGFCHPRASMAGSLLEDVQNGLPFAEVQRRFNAKVTPLRYQRPQAAPAAGNIASAEKVIDKLGIARSLERRFATLDDIETIWEPFDAKPRRVGGVFGHLMAKQQTRSTTRHVAVPCITMTWDKFARTLLSSAEKMEVRIANFANPLLAMTAAVHADAPPILKWDREDRRNTVAWYVYPGGSSAGQWGLSPGYNKVTAVAELPTMWGDKPMTFLHEGVVLIIEGAVDSKNNSAALFPEILRDDLHGVRSTIEAYSRSSKLLGRENSNAGGYDLRKGNARCELRVFSGGAWQEYLIDRWD